MPLDSFDLSDMEFWAGPRDVREGAFLPLRNTPAVVDEYVKAWRDAGIFVMVGTEHNTQERIPVAPAHELVEHDMVKSSAQLRA